jgi:hypothetical protein
MDASMMTALCNGRVYRKVLPACKIDSLQYQVGAFTSSGGLFYRPISVVL